MMVPFEYAGSPARIVFAPGAIRRAGEMVRALGCARALVLTTPSRAAEGQRLADHLGPLAAGVFAEATMHTPVEVTGRAIGVMRETGADCTAALGGGSTTGLGKAIALSLDTPQLVIPTTYAGSEATPILGQTEDGAKRTLRDQRVLPEVVLYDPELTFTLPSGLTMTSGFNAIAHAAEALYARDRNPVSSLVAAEGIRAMVSALPALAVDPADREARSVALYGAWLCGTVLGTVGMALHHKLCHVLGGWLGLPHSETHAIVLPHSVAYNEIVSAAELAPLSDALGGGRPGVALHEFAARIGAPTALRDLGLLERDLDRAAEVATINPYWNPREVTREGVRTLLGAAWRGDPPTCP